MFGVVLLIGSGLGIYRLELVEVTEIMTVEGGCCVAKLRQHIDQEENEHDEPNDDVACREQVVKLQHACMESIQLFSLSLFASYFWIASYLDFVVFLHADLLQGVHSVLINILVHIVHVHVSELELLNFFFIIYQVVILRAHHYFLLF